MYGARESTDGLRAAATGHFPTSANLGTASVLIVRSFQSQPLVALLLNHGEHKRYPYQRDVTCKEWCTSSEGECSMLVSAQTNRSVLRKNAPRTDNRKRRNDRLRRS